MGELDIVAFSSLVVFVVLVIVLLLAKASLRPPEEDLERGVSVVPESDMEDDEAFRECFAVENPDGGLCVALKCERT